MPERLLILGVDGLGRMCAEVAEAMSYYSEVAFLGEEDGAGSQTLDFPVLGTVAEISELRTEDDDIFVAVADNGQRREIFRTMRARGWPVASLCDPSAVISRSARIGEGALLMPRVVVNAGATIGDGVILNTGAIVEHDCEIAAFVHLSPGVCLAGSVRVGEAAQLGIGTIVLPNVSIGAGVIAGAGSVVNKDLPHHVIAVGIPARVIGHADSTVPRAPLVRCQTG